MARVNLDADDDVLVATPELSVVRGPSAPAQPAGIVDLPVNLIQPNPANPRPADLEVEEMAADLKANGQLHPANVMSRAAFAAAKPALAAALNEAPYVAVNGCRRLAGARSAGIPTLDCRVRDDWDGKAIDRAVIRENVHRLDLNPMLLGRQLARMVDDYASERKLAAALAKPVAWVNHRIALTKLAPQLQTLIEHGGLDFKLARECPRLHPDLQVKLATGELDVAVATAWLLDKAEKIGAEEQLRRWKAGPPFTIAAGLKSATDTDTSRSAGTAATKDADPDAGERRSQPGSASSTSAEPSSGETTRREDQAAGIRISSRDPQEVAAALRAQLPPKACKAVAELLLAKT